MHRIKHLDRANLLSPFGPVWDSAGSRGFYGEGYWNHRLAPGLSFNGSTFVTKTITTYPRAGNMPLRPDHAPRAWFHDSIKIYPRKGMVLNSVGLSNPGIEAALDSRRWFGIEQPFMISYMPLETDEIAMAREVGVFAGHLGMALRSSEFRTATVGIQLNVSCPNVGTDRSNIVERAAIALNHLERLEQPVVVKLNLEATPEEAECIARHPACYGICIANSIPFGKVLPPQWWAENFPDGSPLEKLGYGKGGLSGAPLLRLVEQWLQCLRELDQDIYVNAGGGILHPDDVDILRASGANSVFLGSIGILRPWRVRSTIKRAQRIFG